MATIHTKRHIGRDLAYLYGPEYTRRAAETFAPRVTALAMRRFPSLADHIHVVVKSESIRHQVVMNVTGVRSKSGTVPDVATALEFGWIHYPSGRHIAGAHAFRDASKEHLI